MKYNLITVEGNIGVGKTTLTHLLAEHYNARIIFMAERYKQMREMLHTKDLFQSITVSDYLFTKCLLFAKVTLPEEEYRLYHRLFDILEQQITYPEVLIYLYAPIDKLQANIKKRNRSFEQNIPDEYLIQLQETYTSYIKQRNIKTIFIDASNADFIENPKHLQVVIEALEMDLEGGQYYFTLP